MMPEESRFKIFSSVRVSFNLPQRVSSSSKEREVVVRMRRDYFLEKLADAMVHIGEILFALTLAKVLLF